MPFGIDIDFAPRGPEQARKIRSCQHHADGPPHQRHLQSITPGSRVRGLTVSGAAVTYLDVRGDYKGILGGNSTPREAWRLLGVYFDTPKGPYIIRLLGPADTVEFYRKGFEDWVRAFK